MHCSTVCAVELTSGRGLAHESTEHQQTRCLPSLRIFRERCVSQVRSMLPRNPATTVVVGCCSKTSLTERAALEGTLCWDCAIQNVDALAST